MISPIFDTGNDMNRILVQQQKSKSQNPHQNHPSPPKPPTYSEPEPDNSLYSNKNSQSTPNFQQLSSICELISSQQTPQQINLSNCKQFLTHNFLIKLLIYEKFNNVSKIYLNIYIYKKI